MDTIGTLGYMAIGAAVGFAAYHLLLEGHRYWRAVKMARRFSKASRSMKTTYGEGRMPAIEMPWNQPSQREKCNCPLGWPRYATKGITYNSYLTHHPSCPKSGSYKATVMAGAAPTRKSKSFE